MFTSPVQFLPRAAAAAASALVLLAAAALPAQAAPSTQSPGSPSGVHSRSKTGSPSGAHSLRAPVTDENFYFVMADRFSNGNTANDDGGLGPDPMVSGFDPQRKGFYNGGDLNGLLDKLGVTER